MAQKYYTYHQKNTSNVKRSVLLLCGLLVARMDLHLANFPDIWVLTELSVCWSRIFEVENKEGKSVTSVVNSTDTGHFNILHLHMIKAREEFPCGLSKVGDNLERTVLTCMLPSWQIHSRSCCCGCKGGFGFVQPHHSQCEICT